MRRHHGCTASAQSAQGVPGGQKLTGLHETSPWLHHISPECTWRARWAEAVPLSVPVVQQQQIPDLDLGQSDTHSGGRQVVCTRGEGVQAIQFQRLGFWGGGGGGVGRDIPVKSIRCQKMMH